MTNTSLIAQARSLLFVPGNVPQRFEKALASGADLVILDLEDAVAAQDKAAARAAVALWLQGADTARRARVLLRINAAESALEHAADLELLGSTVASAPLAGVVVPKAADPAELARVAAAAGATLALLPLVESAAGWSAAYALARAPQVCRLAFGHLDFLLDMGMEGSASQEELLPVRLALVAASRRAGIAAPVDGITPDIQADQACADDSARSRRLGFGARLCIHPRQVALVHAALAPSAAEIDWARRVLQANESARGGAFQLDGRMVDAPVIRRAERVLFLSGRS